MHTELLYLSDAYLSDTYLSDANLSDANLSGAAGITNEQLEQATSLLTRATIMPDGSKYQP